MVSDAQPGRHEDQDVDTRRVLLSVAAFVGFVILLGGGLSVYYAAIAGRRPLTTTPRPFPAPQLQPNPAQDWENFHAAQEKQLQGYAWVNRAENIVHVPIDRAMALVAARGAQAYEPVEGTRPFPQPGQPPLDGAPRAVPQGPVAPYGQVR